MELLYFPEVQVAVNPTSDEKDFSAAHLFYVRKNTDKMCRNTSF